MKKVHNSDMVAHLWANQSQSEARNQQGNFYFHDSTIWSYGSHFPIARHVGNVVLFTCRDYSSTTAGQKSAVRSALGLMKPIFVVVNVLAASKSEHRKNHDAMLEALKGYATDFQKSIYNKASLLLHWRQAIESANAYAAHFKLARKPIRLTVTVEMREAIAASDAKRQQRDAGKEARRAFADEAARKRFEEKAEAWLKGEINANELGGRYDSRVLLRVATHDGVDQVETTRGAIVPLEDVRRAFVIWSICVRKKTAWHRNGEQIKVGDFQLDSISETGNVIAGCHRIQRDEVERFATTQGWTLGMWSGV